MKDAALSPGLAARAATTWTRPDRIIFNSMSVEAAEKEKGPKKDLLLNDLSPFTELLAETEGFEPSIQV